MTRTLSVFTMIIAATCCATLSAQEAPEGFTAIFDGQSLDGWTQKNGTGTFEVAEGVILGTTAEGSPNSFLCTEKEYGDFELRFEVKCDAQLNSGVQIRSSSKADFKNGRVHGPQIEIHGPSDLSGFIYSEGTGFGWISQTRVKHKNYKQQEWNQYHVVAKGNRLKTTLNGEAIEDTEVSDKEATKGFIGLQVHAIRKGTGPFNVRFKNIFIKELTADEAQPADGSAKKQETTEAPGSSKKTDAAPGSSQKGQ